jgi:ribose-phosphate pyrophosphokinase
VLAVQTMDEDLLLFAGSASGKLAGEIAAYLGLRISPSEVIRFSEGNLFVRVLENVRGREVFLVQGTVFPANDQFMELLFWIDAFKRASAASVTALIPYFSYAKGDKKDEPRVSIRARVCADAIEAAGVDRVITMDLHAGQIQGFFTVPVDHMTALQLFAQYYRDKGFHGDGIVAVSPDPGRAKMAGKFAEMLEADLAIMNKTRPAHDVAAVTEVIGHARGKTAIMTDDLVVTGGTLVAGARALKEAGATEIYACATHGLFPDVALDKLAQSELTEITVTDTVPINPITKPPNLNVLPVSVLLAETIQNVFSGESVSAIFAGENQLF